MWKRSRLGGIADALVALMAMGVLYHAALAQIIWEDFFSESAPAVQQLIDGHLNGFLAHAPAYGGSLLLAGPALALGGAFGGVDLAYRLDGLACMAALAVLALTLAASQRSQGRPALSRWLLIGLLVASPASSWALKEGHPEELLAAALCVGGMLLVIRGRISSGAILLGLAVACKQWAILAVPLGFVVVPRHRLRFSLLTAGSAIVLSAPLALAAGSSHFIAANRGLAEAPYIFRTEQIWWTLHLDYLRPLGGPTSTIFGPAPIALVANYSHPLIVLLAVLLAFAWWLRRRHVQPADALLMLALVLLLRCMLDPWNVLYYQLPFLVSLGAWEVACERRAPLFTLAASFLVWTGFRPVNVASSQNMTNLFYVAWTVPAACMMFWHSLRLPHPRLGTRSRRLPAARALRLDG